MNQIVKPLGFEIIPQSAPFSDAQRSWLNGFFAGFLQLDGTTPLTAEEGAAVIAEPQGDDGEAPWHDQTLPIAERMKLAEGRPLPRRMMAAMAQQDCGQCGYLCDTYAEAIASGAEKKLNLCAPGGKETARMLRALAVELDAASAVAAAPPRAAVASAPAAAELRGTSRDAPAPAIFVSRRRLNASASEKE